MSWQFVVGPAVGGREWSLTGARARKLTAKLTEPSEVSFSLDGRDPLAAKVEELATDVHVLRSPASGTAQLLFRGRVGATGDTLDENAHSLSVTALDYRALLTRRMLYVNSQLTWTQVDQAAIAYGLVTQTQTRAGGDLGITPGVGTATGVLRDRTYEAGDYIGERIQELSEVIDGFDWDVTPVGAAALHLDIWHPARGEDRAVVLEYGGLVKALSRGVNPADYANALRMSGETSGDTPPTPVELAAADLATRPEGRWDKAYGETTLSTQSALAERAAWQLDQAQVVRPAYTLTLKRGAWKGPDHIWLGDPVRLVVYSGRRLRIDTKLRVHEIDISISETGDEEVSLTIGAPKPDFRRRPTLLERRISTLERR